MAPRPLPVTVPPEPDRPRFGRLSLIVLACFLVGLGWPLLAGFDFVQRPPGSGPSKPDDSEPMAPEGAPEPEKPSPSLRPPFRGPARADGVRAAARAAPLVTERESIRVEGREVTSCRNYGELVRAPCDEPDVSEALDPSLAALARCETAQGASGVLSLGLDLDFGRGRVAAVRSGKSTSFSPDHTRALLACAERQLLGKALGKVAHQYGGYTVYYRLRFLPAGSPVDRDGADTAEPLVKMSGQATVGRRAAFVRDGPSRKAKKLDRLLYGTRVTVSGRKGDWYRIKYGAGGSTGWVDRRAIGL